VTLFWGSHRPYPLGHLFGHRGGSGGHIAFCRGSCDLFCFFDKPLSRQEAIIQWTLSVGSEYAPNRAKRDATIPTDTSVDEGREWNIRDCSSRALCPAGEMLLHFL